VNKEEIRRLELIDKRVNEIFLSNGLSTTKINFEIVTAERMIEALAYRLPANFSHWSFASSYEKMEKIYKHSGHGIPYEVVWNFDNPTALLVDTNPFALNVLILAHVYGHVDFHLSNMFMRKARNISDVITEARKAKYRFQKYEKLYGIEEVEKVIDAAMSFQRHQDPDPFADELSEGEIRERCLSEVRAKLKALKIQHQTARDKQEEEIRYQIGACLRKIEHYKTQTPPLPEYDIIKYMIGRSPRAKEPWVADVMSVVGDQMKALAPNMLVQLINEGYATYCHKKVMRQLAKEKFITTPEYEAAITFHAKVAQQHRTDFNVYCVGTAFWEMIEDKWNKGKFGPEWEACKDRDVKANWDKKLGLGAKKVKELRKILSDRMAIENYFDDDFIREEKMYIWKPYIDKETGKEKIKIAEDRPEAIRDMLVKKHTSFSLPSVAVVNGNHEGKGELLLKHFFSGFEIDNKFERGALEKLYFFWEKPVHLVTYEIEGFDEDTRQFKLKEILHSYNGIEHNYKKQK
jgi:stage V sporulation protein R